MQSRAENDLTRISCSDGVAADAATATAPEYRTIIHIVVGGMGTALAERYNISLYNKSTHTYRCIHTHIQISIYIQFYIYILEI